MVMKAKWPTATYWMSEEDAVEVFDDLASSVEEEIWSDGRHIGFYKVFMHLIDFSSLMGFRRGPIEEQYLC